MGPRVLSQVFVTMRLPESMQVGGSDEVNVNIAAMEQPRRPFCVPARADPVRVVCANTQRAALRANKGSGFGMECRAARDGPYHSEWQLWIVDEWKYW